MPENTPPEAAPRHTPLLRYAEWREPAPADVPIERCPDGTQQWSIKYDVLLGQWIIGADQGILWFDDQNLYVVGRLTSFAIPGHRIADGFERRMTMNRPFQRQILVPIDGDPEVPVSIQLDILVTPPFVPENIALLDGLRYCRNHADRELEGQLPPIQAWKNAQTLNQILSLQFGHVFSVTTVALIVALFATLVIRDFDFNPFFTLAIFLCLGIQFYRWASPKLIVSTKALRSYKTYSYKAKAPDLSGDVLPIT